jgi:hypothetical protein
LNESLAPHILRGFVIAQRNESAVPQMLVRSPFDELELPH